MSIEEMQARLAKESPGYFKAMKVGTFFFLTGFCSVLALIAFWEIEVAKWFLLGAFILSFAGGISCFIFMAATLIIRVCRKLLGR